VSVAGFSLLFALPAAGTDGSSHAMHAGHAEPGAFDGHLRGMWAAFAAAAIATALFVTLLRKARDRRERELARLRDLGARYERLAALSTFAASAAHELATPLLRVRSWRSKPERRRDARSSACSPRARATSRRSPAS
jgi:two-component system sensor histidine kinase RegB